MTAGPAAVTIRAISAAVGVSNGALYHSFGSRSGLVGRTWLRAGRRFLEVQHELVDAALSTSDPPAAIVAAAEAPAVFAAGHPASSRLLLTVRRDELLNTDLPVEIVSELGDLDRSLISLMTRLAVNAWDRRDAQAVDTITACIVDLPTAILLRGDRLCSSTARAHLRAAVLAVLAVGPPPPGKGRTHGN